MMRGYDNNLVMFTSAAQLSKVTKSNLPRMHFKFCYQCRKKN